LWMCIENSKAKIYKSVMFALRPISGSQQKDWCCLFAMIMI
jgi:hypothetical protein